MSLSPLYSLKSSYYIHRVIAVEMQEHNFILAPGKAKTQSKKLFQVGKGIKG
jgi:hypothetical protein